MLAFKTYTHCRIAESASIDLCFPMAPLDRLVVHPSVYKVICDESFEALRVEMDPKVDDFPCMARESGGTHVCSPLPLGQSCVT